MKFLKIMFTKMLIRRRGQCGVLIKEKAWKMSEIFEELVLKIDKKK